MKFKEKYTNEKDNHAEKIKISNEAYAIAEYIDLLITKIEHTRLTLMKWVLHYAQAGQ